MNQLSTKTLESAITNFHRQIDQEFAHLKKKDCLTYEETALLCRALADAIPVTDLCKLSALAELDVQAFGCMLFTLQNEVEALLRDFMAPFELWRDWTKSLYLAVDTVAGHRNSPHARVATTQIWSNRHAAVAFRTCPAVDKVLIRNGTHGYRYYINEAYARAAEYVLNAATD